MLHSADDCRISEHYSVRSFDCFRSAKPKRQKKPRIIATTFTMYGEGGEAEILSFQIERLKQTCLLLNK